MSTAVCSLSSGLAVRVSGLCPPCRLGLLAGPFTRGQPGWSNPVRCYRPEKKRQIRERTKENRKTAARKIYEIHGLESPYKIPPKEKIEDYHPLYLNRVTMDETHQHYHEQKTYIFNHLCRLEEGVDQALWLTKSKLMGEGQMPERLQELAARLEFPDMEERVLRSIRKCRQYDTPSKLIPVQRFSYRQNMDFIRLCQLMVGQYPTLLHRAQTDGYYVAAAWHRGKDPIQIRGRSGLLVSSASPLERLASPEEVAQTVEHKLPSFYPLAPTIDLLTRNIYKENHNFTGFSEGAPFPHAHTVFIHDAEDWCRESMRHINAKGVMFAFANTLARAKLKYGVDATFDLEEPIVTQSVVSTGVKFTFIQVQLNTLNLSSDDGVKNMLWLDEGNVLYDDHYPVVFRIFKRQGSRHTKPSYKKKMHNRDPDLGCRDLNVDVFRKFLACYVYGAD
ncbi:large ribosomal subunit protein mL37-like [Diadema antillarum]|uniref:large ribosomal subunit protein mL37-like n=1 Tax=Diadema antillarum TaxID=105358 RepID=UPI003A881816